MDKIAWYESNTLRALLLAAIALVAQKLGIADSVNDEFIAKLVDGFFQSAEMVALAWAAYARVNQPTPPISDTAVAKTVARQGGFARIALMAILALGSVAVTTQITGCTHTREAYKVADTLEERAFVANAHYVALVEQAASLKARGILTGNELRRVQEIETAASPVIGKLAPLVSALKAAQTADNELALQTALDDAVRLIADLVRALKGGAA